MTRPARLLAHLTHTAGRIAGAAAVAVLGHGTRDCAGCADRPCREEPR